MNEKQKASTSDFANYMCEWVLQNYTDINAYYCHQ